MYVMLVGGYGISRKAFFLLSVSKWSVQRMLSKKAEISLVQSAKSFKLAFPDQRL